MTLFEKKESASVDDIRLEKVSLKDEPEGVAELG